ncbi:hypothetical protein RSO01_62420 [Reyranella soli]|uniref:DUF736 domain-containing protein n=1 Tax=Reyranella soli TaxID=1230389 RepID=A0A512NJF4_9HYPH|nr:hypothetical protein RSO01_62420 [Reyranella soli]
MANIGSFKKSGNEYQGEIVTLSVQAKGVRMVPEANRSNDNAPRPPGLRRSRRDRGGLVEPVERGQGLPLPQARRPELHGADLRQPVR